MARSEIGELIDGVLRIGLTRLMKEHGWKKRGRTFHRATEECIQVLNVQASRSNGGDTGRFTINLAVYFPAVADVLGQEREATPAEAVCHVRQRIGFLMPINQDHWWEVKPGADLGDTGVDVAENVALRGLPWFEHRRTAAAASKRAGDASGAYPLVPIALAIAAGDLDAARKRTAQVRRSVTPTASLVHDELSRLHDRYLAQR